MAAYWDDDYKLWRYRKRIELPGGTHPRIKGTPPINTKVAAEAAEREHIERLLHPERALALTPLAATKTIEEAAGKEPTIAALIREYVDTYSEGSSGANRTRACHLRGDVRRYFGHMRPSEIHQGHLDAFRDELRKREGRRKGTKIADQTIKNKSYALLAMLGWAADRKKIARRDDITVNVIPTQAVRAVDDPEVLPLTEEEVAKLLKACRDPRYRAAIRLATEAGLRIGEIIGAQWTDIKDGAITIRRQIDDRNVMGPPKGKLTRTVPLSNATIKALAKVPKRGIWILTRNEDDPAARRNVKRASPPGGHVGYSGTIKAIKAVYRNAKVTFGWRGDEGTINVWHSMRHTYGTRLVAEGVHGEQIQRLMGHKDYRTTQR